MRAAAALVFLLAAVAVGQDAAHTTWWDSDWDCRLVVRTVPAERRGGISVARLNLGEQSDLCQPDGRDIRVVTVDGDVLPREVRLRNNKTLDVLFPPEEGDTYIIYYSNRDAADQDFEWPGRQTGGLTLETRPLNRPVRRPETLESRWNETQESFGSRSWGRVYDLENPFGRDDFYISRYEGTLYCPESGSYLLSINADDCGALWFGDRDRPLCLRGSGTPSSTWQDPRHPDATAAVELEEGIYRIRYYHAERFGSQLAALGWRTPAAELVETIPPNAFVRYLPTEVLARQVREGKPTPYFVAEHRYNLRVQGLDDRFPHYWFKVRWPAVEGEGDEWTYRWDFGDGSTATGREVGHEFASLETRHVTLTASRDDQHRSISRPLSPPPRPVRHMRLEMRVRPESRLIEPGQDLELNVLLRNDSPFRGRVTLRSRGPWRAETESAPEGTSSRRTLLTLPGGQSDRWGKLSWSFDVGDRNALVDVELLLHGRTVDEAAINVLHTDGPLGGLERGPSGELYDGRGRQAVLVQQDVESEKLPERTLVTGGGSTVRTVIVQTGSGLPSADNRSESLADLACRYLEARFSPLQFNAVRRVTTRLDEGEGWDGFVQAYRAVTGSSPNLVLLVYRPDTLLRGGRLDTAARKGAVLLDQVLTQTQAAAVGVAPMPLRGFEDRAAELTRRLGNICRARNVPMAGVYGAVVVQKDWDSTLTGDTRWGATSFLSPAIGMRKMMAARIYREAVRGLGEHFDAAAEAAKSGKKADGSP